MPFRRGPLRPQQFFRPQAPFSGTVYLVPTAAALVLAVFAPTVSTPRLVTPATASLVLTGFAPTVATPRLVTPAKVALLLTRFAPTVTVAPAGITTPPPPPSPPPPAKGGELGHVISDTWVRPQWRPPWIWLLPEKDYEPALLTLLGAGAITEEEFLALLAAIKES